MTFSLKHRYASYVDDPEFIDYCDRARHELLLGMLASAGDESLLVLHDSDPDGYCAATRLNQVLVATNWASRTLKAVAHGAGFRDYHFDEGELYSVIIVLDHEVTPELRDKLKRHCHHLVVFDHHPGTGTIVDQEDFVFFDERWSTTALVDGFVTRVSALSHHPVIAMVDHYDKWRFWTDPDYDETVHCLISRVFLDGPSRTPWDKLLHMDTIDLVEFLEEGRAIRKIQDRQIEAIAEKYTYFAAGIIENEPRTFALVLHSDFYDRLGDYLLEKNPSIDFVVIAKLSKRSKPLKLHFRSRDDRMDVRQLAMSLGGGGHRNAAGVELEIKDLPALLTPFKFSFM